MAVYFGQYQVILAVLPLIKKNKNVFPNVYGTLLDDKVNELKKIIGRTKNAKSRRNQ